TCKRDYPIGKLQAGHFIPGREDSILFDPVYVHAQCYRCNIKRQGEWLKYFRFMEKKHGREYVLELMDRSEKKCLITPEWIENTMVHYLKKIKVKNGENLGRIILKESENGLDEVVVKFAGDSGDGMQLTGSQFSDTSAFIGNDLSTFPDYPSEIRAPGGTIAGVSGFQVHIGQKEVHSPGDQADVLVAMNPAALKANMRWIKDGATIIIDIDNFDNKHYKKAGYVEDPLGDGSLEGYNVVKAPITHLTRSTVKEFGLDIKTADKTKNQFVAGLLYWLFNRDIKIGENFLKRKFKNKQMLVDANIKVLREGYNYAETIEAMTTTFMVNPAKKKKGLFRNITGNQATAWGLIAASERSGRPLFLGSYPITPATEILQELASRKHLGVKTFQAEDEIAGISAAIGASYAGHLAATSTSGPGLALKGESIGLAVMTELPLVIINVQRGGPSTGLPTKTEQADLMQALYGRSGESPVVVMA
ncbi:hypothetical protein LCGC14_2566830, partial [marine sediment metagenome]